MKYLILILWGFLLATSCRTGGIVPDKPVVSVSIIPQQYFIEQLAGDLAEVNVLVPPGASPATYEPTVSQLGKLEQSAVYMRIGYIGFEQSWMDNFSAVNPEMKLVDLSEGVDVIKDDSGPEEDQHGHSHKGHVHHGTDPHIWMSVRNARIIVRNIHRELLLLFPEKKEYLDNRLKQFSNTIDSLDQAISGRLESLENRKFMIYHPALTYYARDYGLEQISLEKEGKSPSPSHLKKLSDQALQEGIDIILIQSQFDSDNAKIIARETGSEIIQFDPLDQNWSEQMYYIAEQLNPSW
jgi:zinc transport system substrate-binding protein